MFFSNKICYKVFAQINVFNVYSTFVEGNVLLNVLAFIVISNVDLGMHAWK